MSPTIKKALNDVVALVGTNEQLGVAVISILASRIAGVEVVVHRRDDLDADVVDRLAAALQRRVEVGLSHPDPAARILTRESCELAANYLMETAELARRNEELDRALAPL